ncbi:hypothetical protein B0E45_29785 [Sinorhizobium sp. A49]|uniref:hypothetical protein n=1 Tax=Sinorhizobium sp. A49 TaxID=1945861 RepID=UPI0009852ECD|nr:hypothetical protein [Sinorhizobium sp. A49]OOG63088.1 hypothetical protein B0E45_29785 [Sinorhizobium sp. A49]
MNFHIDMDAGAVISGWLIPDNPADVPEFRIKIPDRKEISFSANVLRSDLRDLGIHATGLAGFHIDEQYIVDLADQTELTIFEVQSGLPIYRRFNPQKHIEQKLLLMDVGAFPQIAMLRRLMVNFTQSYPVVERLSLETIGALLSLSYARSVFIAGQPNWMRHGALARERGFLTAALLRDPFEELAERLLFLANVAKLPTINTTNGAIARYFDLLPFVRAIDFSDEKSVLTSFRGLSSERRRLLRSPMTSIFGSTPDEELQRRNVAVALDNLAQIDIVGTRDQFGQFVSMLDEYLGISILAECELATIDGTAELTEILRGIGLVADLLDEDVALYSFACEAVEAAFASMSDATFGK